MDAQPSTPHLAATFLFSDLSARRLWIQARHQHVGRPWLVLRHGYPGRYPLHQEFMCFVRKGKSKSVFINGYHGYRVKTRIGSMPLRRRFSISRGGDHQRWLEGLLLPS